MRRRYAEMSTVPRRLASFPGAEEREEKECLVHTLHAYA